ncbi:MAG: hypothetical protein ACK4F9_02220 [Brevinematia bacterium]
MDRVKLVAILVAGLILLGCPREKYVGIPSGSINIPLNTYSGVLVAKLSAFDEVKKLYYSTFRNVPLKYPYSNTFVIKDIRNLKSVYNQLKDYVPSAVREDNFMIRVGDDVVGYDFLRDKSAVLITFGSNYYDVSIVSSSAVEKNDKVYVSIEYSKSPSYEIKYPYLLLLFDNPIRKDIEVFIGEKK